MRYPDPSARAAADNGNAGPAQTPIVGNAILGVVLGVLEASCMILAVRTRAQCDRFRLDRIRDPQRRVWPIVPPGPATSFEPGAPGHFDVVWAANSG